MKRSREFALGMMMTFAICAHGQVNDSHIPAKSIAYLPEPKGYITSEDNHQYFVEGDFEYTVIKGDSVASCALSRDFYLTMRLNPERQKRSIIVPASITHDGVTYTVQNILPSEFTGLSGCPDIDTIIVSEGIESIDEGAFAGCRSLKHVSIPASTTYIRSGLFAGCPSLSSIVIDKDNPDYESPEGSCAIMEKRTCTLVAGCKSTVIPQYTKVIGERGFEGCDGMTSIIIPEGITQIGNGAFEGCANLRKISLPNSLTDIGQGAFSGCVSLDSLYIPSNVTKIFDGSCFEGCMGLKVIKVAQGNNTYDSRDNCNAIIRTADNALVVACKNTVIPQDVRTLVNHCFSGHGIRGIRIPAMVDSIETHAFYDCPTLVTLTVDSGNKRFDSRIDCNAVIETATGTLIAGCNATFIPSDVKAIGRFAFYAIHTPSRLVLPYGLKEIEDFAFYACDNLQYVHIPETVTSMEESAFSGCRNLKAVRFDARLDKMPYGTFTDCGKLEYIEINNNSTEIDSRAFDGCTSLKRVILPGTIKEIGWHAFHGCPVESDIKRLCDNKKPKSVFF